MVFLINILILKKKWVNHILVVFNMENIKIRKKKKKKREIEDYKGSPKRLEATKIRAAYWDPPFTYFTFKQKFNFQFIYFIFMTAF